MKYGVPIVAVALATLLAVVLAGVTNLGVGYFLGLPSGAAVNKVRPAVVAANESTEPVARLEPTKAHKSKKQLIDTILHRNLFDSSKVGQTGGGGTDDRRPTDLNLKLVGTLVAEPEMYSTALIANADATYTFARPYSLNYSIADAKIIKIEDKRVTLLRASGAEEVLVISEDEPRTTEPKMGTTRPTGKEDDEPMEGVAEVSENHYEVSRELIDKYLQDIDGISRLGRALPHKDANGDVDGFRLSGIRRGSVAEKLGIRNGDVVHGVNGQPLTSMAEAMKAFQSLSNDSAFTFDVTRRGQQVKMEYTVR